MSSQALAAVMTRRGLSDLEFRILIHIADGMNNGYAALEVDRLAGACGISEEMLKEVLRTMIKRHPICRTLRINSPANRCPGPNRIEGKLNIRR